MQFSAREMRKGLDEPRQGRVNSLSQGPGHGSRWNDGLPSSVSGEDQGDMPKEQYYIDMINGDWRDYVKPVKVPILEKRIEISSACDDAKHIPRVENAGACMVDEGGMAVQIMHNGLKVLYGRYYGAWVNEIIRSLDGVHEPQEEMVFHEVLKHIPEGATMVEAGCYWGYYSMWFTHEVPDGRTYMVEPHSNQMRVAQRNFEVNGLKGDFTTGYFGTYPEKKLEIQQRRSGGEELPRYTVREFMELKGLDRITLLHSDIQGHEEEMLSTAEDVLAEHLIDYLFISTHGRRHPACKTILERHGYRIIAEHSVGESASADGLLVAQSPELPEIGGIDVSRVEGLVQAHS